MPNQIDYSILGLLDGTVSAEMAYSEFEERLIHSLLLEPGFLLTDAYLFSSPVLFRHVEESQQGGKSLFEMAVEQGLVIPAPRHEVASYEEMYDRLVEDRLAADWAGGLDLALRLDSLTSNFNPRVWPTRMGASYAQLIREVLQSEPREVEQALWRDSEDLRYEVVEKAIRSSEKISGEPGDLRRGELVRAVWSHFNLEPLGPADAINRNVMVDTFRKKFPEQTAKALALEAFFDWTDEIHRSNYASRLAVRSSLFWDPERDADVLDPVVEGPQLPRSVTRQADLADINAVVRMPRASALMTLAPEDLLRARDRGMAWFAKAKLFMRDPSSANRIAAEERLDQFAKAIGESSVNDLSQQLTVRAQTGGTSTLSTTAGMGERRRQAGVEHVSLIGPGAVSYQYDRPLPSGNYRMNRRSNAVGRETAEPISA